MTCCGRCKICRPEWDELEAERDRLAAEVERLRGLLRDALPHVENLTTYQYDQGTDSLREIPGTNLHQRISAEVGKDTP